MKLFITDEMTIGDIIDQIANNGGIIRVGMNGETDIGSLNVSIISSNGSTHEYENTPIHQEEKRYSQNESINKEYKSIIEYSKAIRFLQKRNMYVPIGKKTTSGEFMAIVMMRIITGTCNNLQDAVEVVKELSDIQEAKETLEELSEHF